MWAWRQPDVRSWLWEWLGVGRGITFLIPEEVRRGLSSSHAKARGQSHPPSSLRGHFMLRTEEEKPGCIGAFSASPTRLLHLRWELRPPLSSFSFTRFVFFSSALLADMTEEARVFSTCQPPHDGPVTRPLAYAAHRSR